MITYKDLDHPLAALIDDRPWQSSYCRCRRGRGRSLSRVVGWELRSNKCEQGDE